MMVGEPSNVEAVVAVSSVSKSYGGTVVLAGVTVSIHRGEIFGLLGVNGAGKSTLLESIVGLRRIDSGQIAVLGVDPTRRRDVITTRVAVQPQSAALFETLTVLETLRLYASFHPTPADVATVMNRVGLTPQSNTWARNLSGGQQKRLLIGVAIIGNPEIVVLDEPSAGLDPKSKHGLFDLIRRLADDGVTVIFSTHDMREAGDLCDRVGILHDGTIQALGTPSELIDSSDSTSTLEEYFLELVADPLGSPDNQESGVWG